MTGQFFIMEEVSSEGVQSKLLGQKLLDAEVCFKKISY